MGDSFKLAHLRGLQACCYLSFCCILGCGPAFSSREKMTKAQNDINLPPSLQQHIARTAAKLCQNMFVCFWPDFVRNLTPIIPAEALPSLFVPAQLSTFNSFLQKFVFSSPLHWRLCLLTIKICVGLLFHKSIFHFEGSEKTKRKKTQKL